MTTSKKILATIICPECQTDWRDTAPGSVECPNHECRLAFEVDNYGTPIQYTVPVKCPHCGDDWYDDAPGLVECPTCKSIIEVDARGNEVKKDTSAIECPECGEKLFDNAPGAFKCAACDHEFNVDEDGKPITDKALNKVLDKMSPPIVKALNYLRHKLLDLTTRNRLLSFKESSRSLRIIDDAVDDVYRMLVHEGASLELIPSKEIDDEKDLQQNLELSSEARTNRQSSRVTDSHVQKHGSKLQTPFTPQPLERRCRRLLQESRTAIEETGSNMLFLAAGFLNWYEDESSSMQNQAPLILIPVRIERARINRRTNCYSYIISYTGEDIETNLSLTEKLDHDFDLILPEIDEDVVPSSYFTKIDRAIRENQRWSLSREMLLGMFSFAKILMFKDLDNNRWPDESQLTEHENVMQILMGKTTGEENFDPIWGEEYFVDKDPRSQKTPLILDADSSQLSSIIDALWERKNIVVEGPPGTGKSQTITNLISASLNEGLSVLFVAEKKAALDVVKSRLDNAGLGVFCLELHSHKTQKGQLHEDIAKRISQKYPDADIIDHEIEDLYHESSKIQQYSNVVNQTVGPHKEKIFEIFWKVERLKTEIPPIDLHLSVKNSLMMTRQQIENRVSKLQELARLREDLPDSAITAWQGFRPSTILPGDEQSILMALVSLIAEIDKLSAFLSKECFQELGIEFTLTLLRELVSINSSLLDQTPRDFDSFIGGKFLDLENVKVISKMAADIQIYRELILKCEDFIQKKGNVSEEQIEKLASTAKILVKMGYGEKTPSELSMLVTLLKRTCDDILELENSIKPTHEHLFSPPYRFKDVSHICNIAQVLKEAPKDILIYAHAEHTLQLADDLFKKVQIECKELHKYYNSFSKLFEMQLLPESKEILLLAQELKRHKHPLFAIFSRDYRKTRRCIKGFLVEEKNFKKRDIVEQLRSIAHLLNLLEKVRMNEDYNKVFGSLYSGIDTDWARLESLITWSQKFREIVGSERNAYSLMQNIGEVRERVAETSKKSHDILTRILSTLNENAIPLDMDKKLEAELEDLQKRIMTLDGHLLKELLEVETLHDVKVTSILNDARKYLSATKLLRSIEGNQQYVDLLGAAFNGINTDAQKYLLMAEWVKNLITESQIPPIIINWLVSSDTSSKSATIREVLFANKEFIECHKMLCERLEKFGALDEDEFFSRGELTIFNLRDKWDVCVNAIPYLITWSEYCRCYKEASDFGLADIVNLIESKKIVEKDCDTLYRFIVYSGMANDLIRKHPELASFTRANYENMIRRFVDIDKKISKRWQERIAYNISKKEVPRGVGSGYVSEYTDLNLLLREIQKRKRHIPIRQLLKRAGDALQALKPCFMMSPMSVAQYLEPGKIKFDMVIMDEASQIRPADAIGAIARSEQFVIVGDPNQLPPTSFFERTGGEDYAEEDSTAVEDMESILDICLANYQKRRLRWHYRSEHESLIAFSNRQFYDDDLIVFPAPHNDFGNNGIFHHFIEGAKYQKGRNRLEAERVADAVTEHFSNHSALSLGVATFNREQADLIQDVLERRQKELPWLDNKLKGMDESLEPFFIKNLENVQGDERDVIFISTTYGPDAQTGIVYQRFGPITADTGWRRLNVIVTRAKKRLELFTSMRSTDIKLGATSSRGVQALKAYLEYAETRILPTDIVETEREPGSDFEIAVARILRNNGYNIKPQIGVAGFFIDIGVKHPEREGEYICGIECDGASYHSAKSVRDRDRLRQEILVRKGWNIHRIWSTDWIKNREKEVQRLLHNLKKIVDKQQPTITAIRETPKEPGKTPSGRSAVVDKVRVNLRDLLLKYNEENIIPRYPDQLTGILRDEILDYVIKFKPLTRAEFLKCIPLALREKTDGQQMQFIDDIFDIIDDYVSLYSEENVS
jgi:superfamily I DNA and/or RNA helicase/uncharacterized Zn finger protein (UPF0148 family)